MGVGAFLSLWPGSEMNFAGVGAGARAFLPRHASIQHHTSVGPSHFMGRRSMAISSDPLLRHFADRSIGLLPEPSKPVFLN